MELWGQDGLLVRRSDIIQRGEALALDGKWLRVSDNVKGYEVVELTPFFS